MAIKFFKYKRKVYSNGIIVDKYMPVLHLGDIVGFEELSEMIEKKSTMSRGDVMGVLAEVEHGVLWGLTTFTIISITVIIISY